MTKLMNYSNQEKVRETIAQLKSKRRKERTDRDKVRLLQLQLYDKAKVEHDFRFYILYDKVFQVYLLREAYRRVKSKGGASGVDGLDFAAIESGDVGAFLLDLSEDLRKQTYRPSALKRVWIQKTGGGKRPLSIPTIRDRVAQMACKLVLEPIFEADFEEHSYGFRPNRSAADAMGKLKEYLGLGYVEVYDADISQYFDTIPHNKLLITLEQRVSDPRVIRLIRKWLKAPIRQEDGTHSGGKKCQSGIPQGGVISPLLSNIYLNLLDRMVARKGGLFDRNGIKMIRYADDFILLAHRLEGEVIEHLKSRLLRMGLKLNEDKTRRIKATEKAFDFLGFTIRYDKDIFGRNKRYWNIFPSNKAARKMRQKINALLKQVGHYPPEALVKVMNPVLRGWINYFTIDKVSYPQMQMRDLDHYLNTRIYRYYNRKSQRGTNLKGQQAYKILVEKYGLIKPSKPSKYLPLNALKRKPIGKPYAGKPHVRFDEGGRT